MNIIYENKCYQYQSLILPKHQRTVKFKNEIKLVEIPKSIIFVSLYKEDKYIDDGLVCDFELNYNINFGNQTCTNGKTFKNINEYIAWYWNSKFEEDCKKHNRIINKNFRKCSNFYLDYLYYLAKYYQTNKLEIWKKEDQKHILNCSICREESVQ